MADNLNAPLQARPVLDGFLAENGTMTLTALTGWSLTSMGLTLGGESAFAKAASAVGFSAPAPGCYATDGERRLLGLAPDQFLMLNLDDPLPDERRLHSAFGDSAYLTDQSDGWACLRLSGPDCRAILERLVMVDITPGAFPPGSALARTMIHHMGAIVLAEANGDFLLLSASSSAGLFWHAIEEAVV